MAAQTPCRQALALGLDVSGSVDAREYRLQLDGLATALGDAEVAAALLDPAGGTVDLAVFEWSDPTDQRLVIDWVTIRDAETLAEVQRRLHRTDRAEMGPSTGLGEALRYGLALLDQRPACWTRTLDLSGDGRGNTGRRPQDIPDAGAPVTVNGLVIGPGIGDAPDGGMDPQTHELAAYYTAYVIRGPAAFVEVAQGFDDYATAMRRKLLRELQAMAIGQLATVP
ncbi:DUF1194 domain-containing protein [Thalassorhabdomicrobium marinisediminis]|uniref:DUF1194 domain-containing protein n=1 Tax=Thalassorhabdomicrobium marinisediminis TaxID=2170577 RepID=UPI0024916831|nr:DUF1194 domain-containing protein [Thalassorhabdomicrobium marinisediminis]